MEIILKKIVEESTFTHKDAYEPGAMPILLKIPTTFYFTAENSAF